MKIPPLIFVLALSACVPAKPIDGRVLVLHLASGAEVNKVYRLRMNAQGETAEKSVRAFAETHTSRPCTVWMPLLGGPADFGWLKTMYHELRHCEGWKHE